MDTHAVGVGVFLPLAAQVGARPDQSPVIGAAGRGWISR